MKPVSEPAKLDLRGITRKNGICTVNLVTDYVEQQWLLLGEAGLRHNERANTWRLQAYLDGATDFEHDSAHALSLPLIGLTFQGVRYSMTELQAWIDPEDSECFRIPAADYDPRKHEDTEPCPDCKDEDEKHLIVPEGFYQPPENPKLFNQLKGKRVVIYIGSEDAMDLTYWGKELRYR